MILSENAHVKFIQQNEGFDFFLMNKNLRANKANLHLENLTYVNSDQETPGCILQKMKNLKVFTSYEILLIFQKKLCNDWQT